jgi:hypothetical protein
MNLPANVLLSDEFVVFSAKITALHEKKKEMNADFKKLYERHKASVTAIDQEAKKLQDDFVGEQEAPEAESKEGK